MRSAQPRGRFGGSMQCPYHAWTYGLDGRLSAARNMQELPGFELADFPLIEAGGTALYGGFVFVTLEADGQPFARTYADLLTRFAAWDLGGLRVARSIE